MKVIAKPDALEKARKKKGLTIAELVRRVNAINEAMLVTDRMTRSSYYWYMDGIPPSYNRIYSICAILEVNPSKIFTTYQDDIKFNEIKKVYAGLSFKRFKKHST